MSTEESWQVEKKKEIWGKLFMELILPGLEVNGYKRLWRIIANADEFTV